MLATVLPNRSLIPTASSTALSLVELSAEHPGFSDRRYRRRREEIACATTEGRPVEYSSDEHGVWATVYDRLVPMLLERACEPIRSGLLRAEFCRAHIPSLDGISRRTEAVTGFRICGAAGLVQPRDFFAALSRRVFVATQYVRHPSRPWYTPEPDVIHEYFGHVPGFLDPRVAQLNQAFGAAAVAQPERIEEIARVYWYTMEFGLVAEGDHVRVLGAGLASSCDELSSYMHSPKLRPLDTTVMARTPFDPTDCQPTLFVASSFDSLHEELLRWLG